MNTEKAIPVLFDKNEKCCGCSACYAICPVDAIQMHADREGFLYPEINESACIRCFRCIKVCAFKADQAEKFKGEE